MINSDYSSSTQASSNIAIDPKQRKMPLVRRRRPVVQLSSSPVNQVDAQGTAYLCFPEDHSWFQGNISTEDESNYSLYGERVAVANDQENIIVKTEENNNAEGDNEPIPEESDYYRVTMIDHFTGQKYILPKIIAKKQQQDTPAGGNLFTSEHGEVTFQVENIYKGQKADMMIHRYIGSPSLLGKKCLLYSGQINILYNEMAETGRSWSL